MEAWCHSVDCRTIDLLNKEMKHRNVRNCQHLRFHNVQWEPANS